MRPINLKMSAFGPYAGEVEIPMEKLGSQGLYLITGDTGAGKTTIFDAICFALFGEASGSNRESSMFRSKYADPETPTEVELTFLHGGKEYYIKRNPDYKRPLKRGQGTTTEHAKAELKMPDQTVISKLGDVNAAVVGLLGINRNQFSQISMLAQGDFLNLLLADTKQRMVIFRNLFKTGYYQTLQEKLEAERKVVYGQVEDTKKSLNQYISGIAVDEDDVLALEVEKAKDGAKTVEETLDLLTQLIAEDKKEKDSLEKTLGEVNKSLEMVNGNIGAAEAIEKTKTVLAKTKLQLEEALPSEENLKAAFETAKEALKGKDSFTKQAATIEAELPKYDSFDTLTKTVSQEKNALGNNHIDLETQNKKSEEEAKKLESLKKEAASFTDVSAAIAKLSAELEKGNTDIETLTELMTDYRSYLQAEKNLQAAQQKYARDDAAFKELQHKYEALDQAFRDGQAGFLASSLEDGVACPVCGSTTHPKKAKLTDQIPTKEELDQAKQEAEEARALATASGTKAGSVKATVETRQADLLKKAGKILKLTDLQDFEASYKTAFEAAEKKKSDTEKLLLEERTKEKRKGELELVIPQVETGLKKLTESISQLKQLISAASAKLTENEKQLSEIRQTLKFESKSAAMTKRKALLDSANKLQEEYDRANEKLQAKTEEIVGLRSTIESYQKTIAQAKVVDLEGERAKKAELDQKQSGVIEKNQRVASRIETNQEIRANMEKQSGKIVQVEERLKWISALSYTANGKLAGKEKIMLETYIQTTYFERIINRANLRLMTMSGGQYELKRTVDSESKQGQQGLELSVIDHYNGSERSVKTLSGGESFMASLSLALGLSDEVQSSAGGIQIDTMFVDEGFGSLDPDALDQAYKALANLTEGNRLVGIISHVADLKLKIDPKIVVKKGKSGGSYVELETPYGPS